MPRPSSQPLVDRILEGRLEQELTDRRTAGESYDAIARWFAATHDLEVTSETVRQWCLGFGIQKAEPKSEAKAASA